MKLKKKTEVEWQLRSELEWRNRDEMEFDEIDLKYLLKDKKMEKLFEQNSKESLKNRFVAGLMTVKVTKRTPNAIKTIEKEGQTGFFEQAFEKLDFGLKSLLVLVGDLPILKRDEKLLNIDNILLSPANLPEWMEFHTLYVFNDFEGIGDVKTHDHAFDLRTVKQLFPRPEQKSFIIELNKHFVEITGGQYWKLFTWFSAIRASHQQQLEAQRSANKVIRVNVHVLLLHSLFGRNKKVQREIEKMVLAVDPSRSFGEFQSSLATLFVKVDHMFDAFYSKVVVNYGLIKACIKTVHILVVKRMIKFWKKKGSTMNAFENLTFASLVVAYKDMISSWGLIEDELENFVRPTIVNFVGSTFQKVKQVIAGILIKAESDYEMINGKIYSPGGQSIISLCGDNFEHYTSVPCEEAARYLLSVVSIIINIFQRFLLEIIEEEESEEMLAAHMNSLGGFMINFRTFLKKVVMKTQNRYSYKTICDWVGDMQIIKAIGRLLLVLENKIIFRLKEDMKTQFVTKSDFLKFNVKSFLESFFNKFQFVFKKIERGNLERIAKKMLNLFSLKYVELGFMDLSIFSKDLLGLEYFIFLYLKFNQIFLFVMET